jgi:hypothetical protein
VTSTLFSLAKPLLAAAIILVCIVGAFIGAALLLGLSELVADEARGWLELAPRGILRLVAMRLPSEQREAIYNEEWLPELLCELRKGEGRPITRFVIGIMFAADIARSARSVAHELDGVRDEEPEGRHVELFDTGAGVDSVKVYRHERRPASAGDWRVADKSVGGVEVRGVVGVRFTASASVRRAGDEPDQGP